MDKINDIINTFLATENFHKVIELSKKYPEIDLNDIEIFKYCPDIIINMDIMSYHSDSMFKTFSIGNLHSFTLSGSDEVFTTISHFLWNIDNINKITFKVYDKYYEYCVTTDGDLLGYYISDDDDGHYTIEFELHSLSGLAMTDTYCIYGTIINKLQFFELTRKLKMNSLVNKPFDLKEKIKELGDKVRNEEFEEKNKKYLEETKNKNYKSTYTIISTGDSDIIRAC